MTTANSSGAALKATAALALAAGASALGLYVYRNTMGGSAGFQVGSTPARSSGKRKTPAEDVSPEGPLVRVFFGSQTGTAEEFAKMLAKDARSQGINAVATDLERFESGMLPGSFAIFLVATYGEGDPTDNAKRFHTWLAQAAAEALSGCHFAVFGLGNTQYEHYNSEGKFVDNLCEKCGGDRMLQLGLGDDDKNIRGDFDEWMDKLWPALREHLGMDQSSQAWLDTGVEYKCTMQTFASEVEARGAPRLRTSNSVDAAMVMEFKVKCNREVCTGGDRSCRHLELDILDEASSYETGDHIAILPDNDSEQVEALARRLGADAGQWISMKDEDHPEYKLTMNRVFSTLPHSPGQRANVKKAAANVFNFFKSELAKTGGSFKKRSKAKGSDGYQSLDDDVVLSRIKRDIKNRNQPCMLKLLGKVARTVTPNKKRRRSIGKTGDESEEDDSRYTRRAKRTAFCKDQPLKYVGNHIGNLLRSEGWATAWKKIDGINFDQVNAALCSLSLCTRLSMLNIQPTLPTNITHYKDIFPPGVQRSQNGGRGCGHV